MGAHLLMHIIRRRKIMLYRVIFQGGLTGSQNLENLTFIEVLIKDDSLKTG